MGHQHLHVCLHAHNKRTNFLNFACLNHQRAYHFAFSKTKEKLEKDYGSLVAGLFKRLSLLYSSELSSSLVDWLDRVRDNMSGTQHPYLLLHFCDLNRQTCFGTAAAHVCRRAGGCARLPCPPPALPAYLPAAHAPYAHFNMRAFGYHALRKHASTMPRAHTPTPELFPHPVLTGLIA